MKVKVVLYPSDEGYAVSAPSLPGCWSQGATREEALANIADAVCEYPEANAITMAGIVKDPGLTIDEFRKLL